LFWRHPITHLPSPIPHFLASFLPQLSPTPPTPDALPMDNLTTDTRRAPSLLRMRLPTLDRSRSRSLCHTAPLRRPPVPSPVLIPISIWCGSLSSTFAYDVMRDRQPALSHGLLGSALLLSFRMSSIPCQYHILRAIYPISRPISLWVH
jgi:hypothetical protein